MYSSSKEELKIEYWVRTQEGSLIRRFNGGALYSARKEAQQAQGTVFEVMLDTKAGAEVILTEVEI